MTTTHELAKTVLEINDRHKYILSFFSKDDGDVLRHLAASSLHLAFFMKDIHNLMVGEEDKFNKKLEEEFLKECGCNFNNKENS